MTKLKTNKKKDKKRVNEQAKNVASSSSTTRVVETRSRTASAVRGSYRDNQIELTFNKQNYILMGVGFLLIILGMLLMTGGYNTDPNVWDENVIYSFRRITLAPILILAGLIVEVYAIFK